MIDLSELTYDEDFCTAYEIERHSTTWANGRPTYTGERVTVTGIVSPSSAEDVEMLEQADRKHGLKTFYTNMEHFQTTDTLTTADFIIWNGKRYKVLHVFDYRANGYSKAICDLLGDDVEGKQ